MVAANVANACPHSVCVRLRAHTCTHTHAHLQKPTTNVANECPHTGLQQILHMYARTPCDCVQQRPQKPTTVFVNGCPHNGLQQQTHVASICSRHSCVRIDCVHTCTHTHTHTRTHTSTQQIVDMYAANVCCKCMSAVRPLGQQLRPARPSQGCTHQGTSLPLPRRRV